MNIYLHSILLLLSLTLSLAKAQSSDSIPGKKIKILPVPAFGYSPETRTYVGAVALFTLDFYQDSITRVSNAKIEFNYTWNRQIILEAGWSYFTRGEKWFTSGLLHFSKYPDQYFGIGNQTPAFYRTIYQSNRVILEGNLLNKYRSGHFNGIHLRYLKFSDIRVLESGIYAPELRDGQSIGLGFTFLLDTRNNILTPGEGKYFNLSTTYNFSDVNYTLITQDFRVYQKFLHSTTLALRFLNQFSLFNVPFYDLSLLGGDQNARGFFYGRYRDRHLSCLQLELRKLVFWRIGLATFGGVSTVYSGRDVYEFRNLKFNLGAGLRFVVDKKEQTSLRFDYAIGSGGSSGFYVAFGESF